MSFDELFMLTWILPAITAVCLSFVLSAWHGTTFGVTRSLPFIGIHVALTYFYFEYGLNSNANYCSTVLNCAVSEYLSFLLFFAFVFFYASIWVVIGGGAGFLINRALSAMRSQPTAPLSV